MKPLLTQLIAENRLTAQESIDFERYFELLFKWNSTHNLTAILDEKNALIKHLIDCLSLLPFLSQQKTLLDVGTGAGFPGLVIAIMNREKKITLIEKSAKKCAFLTEVKNQLKLAQVNVICADVAVWRGAVFDEITARAFSTPEKLIRVSAHLLSHRGEYLLMLGKKLENLAQSLPDGWTVVKETSLKVSELMTDRWIIQVNREDREND